jgi:hypothetical protein
MKTIVRAFSLSLGLLASGMAIAQAPPATTPGTSAGRTADHTLGTNTTGTNPTGKHADPSVSASQSNQAVATTNANAPQPAHGANSFTAGQARSRLEKSKFQQVSDLKKDDDGVWRGKATKDGTSVEVWVDYKGNVGQR